MLFCAGALAKTKAQAVTDPSMFPHPPPDTVVSELSKLARCTDPRYENKMIWMIVWGQGGGGWGYDRSHCRRGYDLSSRHHLCHSPARYQINARTELAVRYNDISPLENHHCAVAFQILSLPECNIFANVDLEAFKQIRQVNGAKQNHLLVLQTEGKLNVWSNLTSCFQGIITLILATDMARHGEILDSFKQKVDNFDFTNEEHVTCVSRNWCNFISK